ncbi:hypothetical protein ACFPM0_17900 [Pseudonocardia sulfidoxydans]|uniref:hypothetical protein n=1 Tax=Pseudonocardia sulfidoxydans TaxID=54011 RepID=UPI0036156433
MSEEDTGPDRAASGWLGVGRAEPWEGHRRRSSPRPTEGAVPGPSAGVRRNSSLRVSRGRPGDVSAAQAARRSFRAAECRRGRPQAPFA